MLATQNPVDLDYKGLANMGTWLVGTLQTERDRERLREGLEGSGGLDGKTIDRLLDATGKRVFLLHDVHRKAPVLLQSRWAMSYLRGPLTREEISRLMQGRAPAEKAGSTGRASAAPAATLAPVLPAPLRSQYYDKYQGELADPHLLVKYAVRYKGVSEAVDTRAWPLAGATAAEVLEAEAFEVEEARVAAAGPGGLRYSDLPSFLATSGAKALEKALKERLADKLAVRLLYDPATKASSVPGETAAVFASRLGTAGAPSVEKARDRVEKKRRDLELRQQELQGRKTEKWLAVGTAVLANVGLFMGRKRTISGVGTALSKNRMEGNAEARVEALQAELAELEGELQALTSVDPARFEERDLVPSRTDVKVLRYDVLWVY